MHFVLAEQAGLRRFSASMNIVRNVTIVTGFPLNPTRRTLSGSMRVNLGIARLAL